MNAALEMTAEVLAVMGADVRIPSSEGRAFVTFPGERERFVVAYNMTAYVRKNATDLGAHPIDVGVSEDFDLLFAHAEAYFREKGTNHE